MGRRKFRLSSLQKNFERKSEGQRPVGRPCKNAQHLSVPSVSNVALSSVSPVVSDSLGSVHSVTPGSASLVSSHHSVSPPPDTFSLPPIHTHERSSTPCSVSLSSSVSSGVDSFPLAHSSESSSFSLSSSMCSYSGSDESSSSFTPVCVHDSHGCRNSVPPDFSCPDSAPNADISSLTGDLQTLMRNFVLPGNHWIIQGQGVNNLAVYKISTQPSSLLVITHSVRIKENLSWNLSVHGFQVDSLKCRLLSGIPEKLCPNSLEELLKLLDKCNICPGNPDSGYIEMVEAKRGQLMSKNRQNVTATVDSFSPVFLNGEKYAKTVRVSTCELLVEGSKCASCVSYRDSLRSMYHRWLKQKSLSPSKRQSTRNRTNLRWLSTPEKSKRYSQLRTRLDAKEKKIKRLKEKIGVMMEKDHITLDPTLHSDFKAIMSEMSKRVHEECVEDSFKRLFWDQQLKAANMKDARQIRWHPAVIKWCLHLKFISSGGYHALRRSGLITLPSERTLRDYTHWIRAGVGFIPEVDALLVKEANIVSEKDRFVVLSWDEMRIKEGLVFDKHSCTLVGFTNVGDVNDLLDKMEQQANDKSHSNISTHMLLFMVRGLFSTLKFPYVHFATRGISADSLFPIVWEAVQRLESCGMNVMAFCCDGASPNRKFYKMHGTSSGLTYKTPNPFCKGREIFFICDVPHLIKTTRNCWATSFANKYSRALWKDGRHISWNHLVTLYGRNRTSSGLSLVPKLRRDHIYLTSYSRMKVNLAAQVLSSSVAHALEYYGNDDTVETINFIKMFDRFFDCFNVRCISESVQKRKPDLRPYRDPCDSRLTWLVDGFLKYLQDWEDSVHHRKKESSANEDLKKKDSVNKSSKVSKKKGKGKEKKNIFSPSERQRMLLSTQTREGLRITVKSFVEMAPCLLSVPGVEYILSERLCQDSLESFFGKQRAAGGRSDNPTVQQFCKNTVSLRVQGSAALEPVRGNCGKRPTNSSETDVTDLSTPLPKRARYSKH